MKSKKLIAAVLASTLVLSSLSPAVLAADGKVQKEENVYVITDENGNEKKEIVTETLKNTKKNQVISDTSSLKNIQNINGDEKVKKTGRLLKWKSEGKDITYQGTTSKEVPVSIDASYFLDGNSIDPDDLAGKSGKLKIEVDYTSNTPAGSPFMAVSTLILDSSKARNIKVENAKIIEEGNRQIIVGYGLPGLEGSFPGGSLSIPSGFSVSADIKDFEMDGMMSFVTNEPIRELDLDDVNSVMDLTKSLNKLADASDELVEGSDQLYNGISTLMNKSGTLKTGVAKLNSGAKELASGTKELKTGAQEIETGANTLSTKIDSLSTGIKTIKTGADSINTSLDKAGTGLSQTIAGDEQVLKGIQQMKAQTESQIKQVVRDSLEAGVRQALKDQGMDNPPQSTVDAMVDKQFDETYQNALSTNETYQGIVKLEKGLEQTIAGQKQVKASLTEEGKDSSGKPLTIKQGVSDLSTGASKAYEGSKLLKTEGSDKLAGGANTLINKGINPLIKGSDDLSEGLQTLQDGSDKLIDGIQKLQKGSRKLKDGMATFDKQGIQKLVDVAGDLDSVKNRLNSAVTLAKNYDNFAGKASNMDSTVKFVYRSEAIK